MASKASAPENENLLAGLYEAIRALDRRVVVGIAVACGFILVAVCACCIKVLTRKRQGVYASAEKSLEQGRKKDEEEREEILADVYGRSSPGAEDDLGEDDAALKKAWQVIEGDQSSDDDNVLVPARDAEEIFLKQLRAGAALACSLVLLAPLPALTPSAVEGKGGSATTGAEKGAQSAPPVFSGGQGGGPTQQVRTPIPRPIPLPYRCAHGLRHHNGLVCNRVSSILQR
ncbi:unnamed protein product [Prorocentrum cordatum]|uniref:Transmembrane protein n=1 Tax=Prorocentrum cordatum TaxID=2364126 RepID=A0ABN9WSL3_9DINO|nr:unnamed protein product [Polarella glacialis]